jgi:hypothetical protein
MSALGVHSVLNRPIGGSEICARKLNLVRVFDNATGNYVRKRKRLGLNFSVAGLGEQLIQNFSVEFDDLSVGMNGFAVDVADFAEKLGGWNFNIGVLLAGVVENFDAVKMFGVEVVEILIVDDLLTVQNHGRSAGFGGIVLQRQLFRRDGRPIGGSPGGVFAYNTRGDEQKGSNEYSIAR